MQWQQIEIPFAGGLDLKTKTEALPIGSFTALSNVVQNKNGAYAKRNGFDALSNTVINNPFGGTLGAIRRVGSYKDSVRAVHVTGGVEALSAYSSSISAFKTAGSVPPCDVSVTTVQGALGFETFSGSQNVVPYQWQDGVYCNGYLVSIADSTSCTVIDTKTGLGVARFSVLKNVAAVNLSKLIVLGNVVYFIYWDTVTAANMFWTSLDCTSSTTIAAGLTAFVAVPNITDAFVNTSGLPVYDVLASGSAIYIAYVNNSAGTNRATIRHYTIVGSSLVQSSSNALATGAATPACICVGGNSTTNIFVGYDTLTTHCNVIGLSGANVSVTTATLLAVVTLPGGQVPQGMSIVETSNGAGTSGHLQVLSYSDLIIRWRTFTVSAGAISVAGTATAAASYFFPASKQFVVSGRVYAAWIYQDSAGTPGGVQGTTTVVDITYTGTTVSPTVSQIPRGIATLEPGLCLQRNNIVGGGVGQGLNFPGVAQYSATAFSILQPVSRSSSTYTFSVNSYKLDFASVTKHQNANLGDFCGFSAGMPYRFDGNQIVEAGFAHYPAQPGATVNAAVGALTINTPYTYRVIYEISDNNGNVMWSAPSPPSGVQTTGAGPGNTQITVTAQVLQITSAYAFGAGLFDGIMLASAKLFRSANGGVYHFIATQAMDPRANATVTFIDGTTPDSVAAQAPALYTESGALPRLKPPSSRCMITHGDRLALLDASGTNVWYSGQYVYGETPWWNNGFSFPVDSGGPGVALGSLDGRLYVFKRKAVFMITGDGPPDAGGPGYSLPQELTGGVGCISPWSVIAVPSLGIFFQSDAGIFLLTRANEFQFVGAKVEDFTRGAYVSSAIHDIVHNRIYFVLDNTGTRLVFDYIHNVWASDAIAPGNIPSFVGATQVGGSVSGAPLMYIGDSANGQVLVENPNDSTDLGAWVTASASLSFRVGGTLQGWDRITRFGLLAENLTPHGLTFNVSYNYGAVTDTRSFTDAQLTALTTAREQVGIDTKIRKVESMSLTISDSPPISSTGTGRGGNWIGLTFEVGKKSGPFRLPAANTQ